MSRRWVNLGLTIIWFLLGLYVLFTNSTNALNYICVWIVLVMKYTLDTIREW